MEANKNGLLLCTFVKKHLINKKLLEIQSKFNIEYNRIYVLDILGSEDAVITYNVILRATDNYKDIINNTITVHRKKYTNTLYTINAVNEIIKNENDGVIDTNYEINWDDYRNTLLLTNEDGLRILKTKLLKIIYVKRYGEIEE